MTGSASFTMAFCLEAFTSRGSEALPSATWPDDTQVIGAVMRFALRKIPTYGWKRLQLSPRSVLIRGLCLPNTATWRRTSALIYAAVDVFLLTSRFEARQTY
jgi:hypothetical protein